MALSLGPTVISLYVFPGFMKTSFGTHFALPVPYRTFTPLLCRDFRCRGHMLASARMALSLNCARRGSVVWFTGALAISGFTQICFPPCPGGPMIQPRHGRVE